ncbi:MliC family protein [Vibrio proteolyticus]
MNKTLIAAAASVVLFGCAQSGNTSSQAGENFLHYSCDAKMAFDADYSQQDKATVRVDGQDYALTQVPAGSGIRYILANEQGEGMDVDLHAKGDGARLQVGDTFFRNCVTEDFPQHQ